MAYTKVKTPIVYENKVEVLVRNYASPCNSLELWN
jgi:hypothetical protein